MLLPNNGDRFDNYIVKGDYFSIDSAGLSETETPMSGLSNEGGSRPETSSEEAHEIIDKYQVLLEELEANANQQVSKLLSEATIEYQSIKESGEPIPYLELYTKYSKAAKEIESQTDSSFEKILQALKMELSANGVNSSYVTALQKKYEDFKEERQSELIKKVTDRL
jgi:hypothetical protein